MGVEAIREAADQIVDRIGAVKGKGEEATKQALILPLLNAMGFDVWNPNEVCPEFQADFVVKKYGQREKVDLAILIKDEPRIFIEVKSIDEELAGHDGQLARYFNSIPSVPLAVLTNGLEYKFYSDTNEQNIMDTEPFHVCRLDAIDASLEVIARFQKEAFSAHSIRDYATELNYRTKFASFLKQELDVRERELSDSFLKWLLAQEGMYDGRVTANVLERFRPIAKSSLQRVIRDIVRRSVAALEDEVSAPSVAAQPQSLEPQEEPVCGGLGEQSSNSTTRINTTDIELDCFAVMKQIFENSIHASKVIFDPTTKKDLKAEIAYRDTVGYFSVFLCKQTWWIARLCVEGKVRWIGFDVDPEVISSMIPSHLTLLEKNTVAPTRIQINSPDDLHAISHLIIDVIGKKINDRNALRIT